ASDASTTATIETVTAPRIMAAQSSRTPPLPKKRCGAGSRRPRVTHMEAGQGRAPTLAMSVRRAGRTRAPAAQLKRPRRGSPRIILRQALPCAKGFRLQNAFSRVCSVALDGSGRRRSAEDQDGSSGAFGAEPHAREIEARPHALPRLVAKVPAPLRGTRVE